MTARRCAFAVFFLLSTCCAAAGPTGKFDEKYDVRLAPGTWKARVIVTVRVDAAGKLTTTVDTAQPLVIISGPTTVPVDPVDPVDPPPVAGSFQDRVTQVARQINDGETLQDLAIAYSVVILASENPELGDVSAKAKAAAEAVYAKHGSTAAWKPFLDLVSKEFISAQQEGRLSTGAQYVALLTELRDGLLDAQDQEFRRGGRRLKLGKIIEVVQLVLEAMGDGELTIPEVLGIATKVIAIFRGAGMEVIP